MNLTNAQKATLKAAVLAETDPTFVAARAIGNDQAMVEFLNAPSAVDAWPTSVSARELCEAMVTNTYIALANPNRQAWDLLIGVMAPFDLTRQRQRNYITDVWGNTDGAAILTKLLVKATRGEVAVGGTDRTTAGITALDRAATGTLTHQELAQILNPRTF